jgi:D-alanyl-D-alanine dipeptidase
MNFVLILGLLALGGHSTEGCKGRKDPYMGKPPRPAGLIKHGALTDHLRALDQALPKVKTDLRYRLPDNFTGHALYPQNARCWLRPELVDALEKAAGRLAKGGFGLVVYDCYRPWSVQSKLWAACPKRGLVADPAKGSHHNRGAAVDVGLIRLSDGLPLEMPSAFDDLSHRARHSYSGGSAAARQHRSWLLKTMRRVGLASIGSEWWHYQLRGARRFALLDLPLNSGEGPQP